MVLITQQRTLQGSFGRKVTKERLVLPTKTARAPIGASKAAIALRCFRHFSASPAWARRNHKIYDERWLAPPGARLALEVRSAHANKLVVGIDGFAAEIALSGGTAWQRVSLAPADFRNAASAALDGWSGIRELRFTANERLALRDSGQDRRREVGADWQGPKPEFQNLRWETGAP